MRTCAFAAFMCYSNLFALSNKRLAFAANAAPAPVHDINGNNIQTRVEYFIQPVIRGRGGGLTLPQPAVEIKLSTVAHLMSFKSNTKYPMVFHSHFRPVDLKNGIVRLSTDLNIKFSTSVAANICSHISEVWKLDNVDESTGQWFITSGGVEGFPGPKTISNWFKIEKYDDDYKLLFCPKVCLLPGSMQRYWYLC